jgi:hypothetical protein
MAVVGSFIFLGQLLMTRFGHGGDDDGHFEGYGHPDHADGGFAMFKLFSFRTIIAFITFFGWGGVICGDKGFAGFMVAFLCGVLMMVSTAALMYLLMKMQQSGNINHSDYVGCSGTVYLSIPAGRKDGGKVTVTVRNCTREIAVVADEEIKTGTSVKVEEMIGEQKFLVKKI